MLLGLVPKEMEVAAKFPEILHTEFEPVYLIQGSN